MAVKYSSTNLAQHHVIQKPFAEVSAIWTVLINRSLIIFQRIDLRISDVFPRNDQCGTSIVAYILPKVQLISSAASQQSILPSHLFSSGRQEVSLPHWKWVCRSQSTTRETVANTGVTTWASVFFPKCLFKCSPSVVYLSVAISTNY